MIITNIILKNENDVAKVVGIFSTCDYDIDIGCGRHLVDGKSLLGILSFGMNRELTVYANGVGIPEAESLCKRLQDWRASIND